MSLRLRYLLDSDISIHYLTRDKVVIASVERNRDKIILCAPVIMELYYGLLLGKNKKLHASRISQFNEFVGLSEVLPFDKKAALETARILKEAKLRQIERRKVDIMIAAIAITNGLTLVTRNVKDFRDIQHLKLMTW